MNSIKHLPRFSALLTIMFVFILLGGAQSADYRTIQRVNVSTTGGQANGSSDQLSMSADGRFVAFRSSASNLVSGDTNIVADVFVHDRQTGQTTRVSVNSAGGQANGSSDNPSISADGRFVAFGSFANNLVPDDTNGIVDIFVHDRQTGQTTRVNVSSTGEQANSTSFAPSISADGRFVAFRSSASNLVPDDTNGVFDIFVHDRQTGETTRVSVSSTGEQANSSSEVPTISADGRFVAFWSGATNLVPGDTNNQGDIFVHDRQTGQTTRVNVSSTGEQANNSSIALPSISADGRFVAFRSFASNLVPGDTNGTADIFVHDRQTGQTTRVNVSSTGEQANGSSNAPSISLDGRFVAFHSIASNLVSGDTNTANDIFVHDRQTGQTTRVSVSSTGEQATSDSFAASISADGQFIAFQSFAGNLVPGDTNGLSDIFVARALPTAPTSVIAFATSETRAVVAWSIIILDTDAYRVERTTDQMAWNTLAVVPAGQTSLVDTDLACGATYTYRVVAVNAAGETLSPHLARVTTLPCPDDLIVNGGFEAGTNGNADGWTVIRPTNDRRRCNDLGNGSPCAFQFRGGAAENSILRQDITDLSGLTAGRRVQISLSVRGQNAGTANAVLILTYSDGTRDRVRVRLPQGAYPYRLLESDRFTLPQNVTTARFQIVHRGQAGRVTLDDVQVLLYAPRPEFPLWVRNALRQDRQGGTGTTPQGMTPPALPLPLPSPPVD